LNRSPYTDLIYLANSATNRHENPQKRLIASIRLGPPIASAGVFRPKESGGSTGLTI
jgi:hypothetical protein